MIYGTFDAAGLPTGWYPDDIFPPSPNGEPNAQIPVGAGLVPPAIYVEMVANPGLRTWDGKTVAIYTPPAPKTPVPSSILRRQFFQQLAVQGLITSDEARGAVQSNTIPPEIVAIIDKLPSAQQLTAELVLMGDPMFSRTHPVTAAIGVAYGWTSDQIDALWIAAAAL